MQTFTGLQYLMMDIASSFGLDKATWNARLAWFEQHRNQIENLPQPELVKFCRGAEEPAQALAGILAYRKTIAGEATGYLCGLDATASGLQLLALLAGDEQAARICNLVDTGNREDAYTIVHNEVDRLMGSNSSIMRALVKQALMTHLYGSKAEPKKTFGEDTPELHAFYQSIDTLLPGADQLNRDLISLWDPNALAHSWTLPDGFEVVVKVMTKIEHQVEFLGKMYPVIEKVNRPMPDGLSMGANIIHSIDGMVVREMNRRCNYTLSKIERTMEILGRTDCGFAVRRDKDIQLIRLIELAEMTGFLSAAILEYIDHENRGHITPDLWQRIIDLVNSMPSIAFPVICIHDCFKFHANYGNDVRIQYKNILAELAGSSTLDYIASEIKGRPIYISKLSSSLPQMIRNSEYAIC